ncbi:DUF881 domain-containing protein [Ornithinicoccus halotolerans]|uniref:DUF881 domain-containing protein n=1 Tax=Ornithinicoccus halotolerans TaxID=1748220 RepID=UPI001295F278|nr:DUF881 domain-containing protein [Ornithinicoccus halotolerans]
MTAQDPRPEPDPEQNPRPEQDPAAPVEVPRPQAWRRLRRLGVRVSRGSLLAGVLTLLLGLALVVQVRTVDAGDLESLREPELIALLDDVTSRGEALEVEIAQLEQERRELRSARGDEAAAEAARSRLESYQVLAGTVPATGPGVVVLVTDSEHAVSATTMVDLIQELRDAGAEAIQIGSHRVVASTWVGTAEDGRLTIAGSALNSPYRIVALGDPHTLTGALSIPGGFSDSVRRVGAEVSIEERDQILVDALHEPTEPRYARPVPPEEDS